MNTIMYAMYLLIIPRAFQTKIAHCPHLRLSTIDAKCFISNEGLTECNKPLPVGSIVHCECKQFYVPLTEQNKMEMMCQYDGTWSKKTLECEPDCGVSELVVLPLILRGWTANQKNHLFPWHASLFILNHGHWTLSCGGTLITATNVITAAHCVWNIEQKYLKVALGKHFSDFYKTEEFTQIRNVSHIVVQPLYQDVFGNFQSDIAVIFLENDIFFTQFVKPACMNWNLHDILDDVDNTQLGMIAGMGITDNDTESDHLKVALLPLIDNKECIRQLKWDFKNYVTFTSFCAGWTNGTSVCNGDSGGGLLFPMKNNPTRYTLEGIASISSRRDGTSFCDSDYYTVFTKVGFYTHWLQKVLSEISWKNTTLD